MNNGIEKKMLEFWENLDIRAGMFLRFYQGLYDIIEL